MQGMRGIVNSAVGEARWLGYERVTGYAKVALVVSLAFLAFGHAMTWRQGSDLLAVWSAGRAVLNGDAASVYDVVRIAADQHGAGFPGVRPFLNPPPFL